MMIRQAYRQSLVTLLNLMEYRIFSSSVFLRGLFSDLLDHEVIMRDFWKLLELCYTY